MQTFTLIPLGLIFVGEWKQIKEIRAKKKFEQNLAAAGEQEMTNL